MVAGGSRDLRARGDCDQGFYAERIAGADALVTGVIRVGEQHLRKRSGTLFDLLQHRCHRAHVAADVGDEHADDRARPAHWRPCGRHLDVVARAIAAIGHLHDSGFSVRRGSARLVLACFSEHFDRRNRLVDATLVVARCSQSSPFLLLRRFWVVGLRKHGFDVKGCLLPTLFERRRTPK